MRMKGVFLVLVIMFLALRGLGQGGGNIEMGVLPSSPEASSLAKYIDFPISPFTGTHSLELPLHEIKVGNFSMPVALTYHSSGIKVQEIASRVGMGWTLQAGGEIICAVNGKSDLGFYGVVDPNGVTNNISGGTDLFYYSFASYNGKFIISVDPFNEANNGTVKEVIKLDSNNLKISFIDNEHIAIVDESGNKYSFSLGESSTDKITYLFGAVDDLSAPSMSYYEIGARTAWYLRTIQLYTGEVITFNYEKGIVIDYECDNVRNFTNSILWSSLASYAPEFGYSSQRHITTEVLTAINYPGASVSFAYKENRQDLSGDKVLTSVKVFSDGNVKGYRLAHSYRDAFNAANSPSTFIAKRLYLDSVQDISDLSSAITLYKLTYNETLLPHRKSFNQDMWGYYNQTGNTVGILPEVYVYPRSKRHYERYLPFKRPSTEPVELYVPGRNMSVNTSLVQAGILTSITYGNGGSTTFEYEPNEFLWLPETSSNVADAFNMKAGGVRIKRITHTDSTKSQIIKDFEYNLPFAGSKTSGAISILPLFSYPGIADFYQSGAVETVDYYQKVLVNTIRDATVLGGTFNSTVGYRYVTVKTQNSGKTVHQFSFPGAYGDSNDDPTKGCRVDIQGFCDSKFKPSVMSHVYYANPSPLKPNRMGMDLVSDSAGTYPFIGGVNYDWNRGVPIKELQYDVTGRLVSKKEFDYYTITGSRTINEITGADVCCGTESGGGRLVKYAQSSFFTATAKRIKQQRETLYTGSDSIVSVVDMSYDTQKLLLAQQIALNSKLEQKITQYKYPHNLQSGNAVYTEMVNRNMLAPVVEETELLAGKIIKISTTDYDMSWFADKRLVAPKYRWEKYGDNPIKIFEVKSYDSTSHPLSIVQQDGQYSYKWSKNGEMTAQIINALPEESYYESFESDLARANDAEGANTGKAYYLGDFQVPFVAPNSKSYLIDYWYRDQGKWIEVRKKYTNNMLLSEGDAIDDVKIMPFDAAMQTHTYNGIYGVTSIIDVSNKKTTYHYDNFGRLSVIRDRNGNVLQLVRYSTARKPDPETPELYSNNEKSKVFNRTNCGSGYDGGSITYRIPKGKYKSSVSAGDADAKALADIDENGQEYANIFASCVEKCDSPDRKWINGVCERGIKKYTRSVKVDDAYDCYIRYYFSDGSSSIEIFDGTYGAPCQN